MSMTDDTLVRIETEMVPPQRDRGRRRLVAASLLVVVIGGLVIGLVVLLGGGSATKASRLPARPTPLDPAARELLELLSLGQRGVHHARYRAVSPGQPGVTLTIDVWRKDDISRQDSIASDGKTTVHTAAFHLESGDVTCRQEGTAKWRCVPVQGAMNGPEEFTRLASDELAGRTVSVRDATVAGRKARCFTIVGEGQSSEMCLSGEGIALSVSSGTGRLELFELSRSVPDGVFRPPA